MFDITPLEFMQGAIFLLGLLAKGGLVAGASFVVDLITTELSGDHLLPLIGSFIAATLVWIKLNTIRMFFKSERPVFYRARRRMPLSIQRAKDRLEREIDSVYDEAWLHNQFLDVRNKFVDATDRANHVVPASWNWL